MFGGGGGVDVLDSCGVGVCGCGDAGTAVCSYTIGGADAGVSEVGTDCGDGDL